MGWLGLDHIESSGFGSMCGVGLDLLCWIGLAELNRIGLDWTGSAAMTDSGRPALADLQTHIDSPNSNAATILSNGILH